MCVTLPTEKLCVHLRTPELCALISKVRLPMMRVLVSLLAPKVCSGVTRSMMIPGPETEVIGESGSGVWGQRPEKGLILHVLRIS